MKKLMFASLSVTMSVLLLLPFGTRPSAKNDGDTVDALTGSSPCTTCPTVGEQTIYAPLITVPESTGTEINLNCRSPHTMEVSPTFYTRKGQAIAGRAFTMQAAEVKTVDLKTLMPANIRNRKDLGGMSLTYVGRPLEMWGQLRLLRAQNGSSIDVTFTYLPDRRSDVRNGVWSTANHGTAVIAIGNPRGIATKAVLRFADGDTTEIAVPAFGTEIIRRQKQNSGTAEADGVTITSADGSVDLVVAGAVLSTERGFTSSIRFYDTKNVAQQNLFATNARLHKVDSTLVLRNVGNTELLATPRIRPGTGDPNRFIDLPPVTLKASQIRIVDLTQLANTTQFHPEFETVSIEVLNSGPKGSLVGALNGSDRTTGMNYDVPLRDSGGTRNSTGAYPWRVDGDFSTIVSITNVSPLPTNFLVQINYAGGRYILDPHRLAAGATATFDLRKIRDEQIRDRNGNTIPLSIEGGQFRWSVFGPGIGRLIGRAEMLSASRGISSSYSCGTTCPPSYDHGWVDPDPSEIPEGGTDQVDALQMNVDSFNNQYGPYSSNVVSWGSSNTNVATVSFGTVSAVGVGGATLTATVEYPLYFYDSHTMDCIENGTNQTNVQGAVQVQPTVFVSGVTATSTAIALSNGTSTVRVEIAASTQVPAGTKVDVELFIQNNPAQVSMAFGASGNQRTNQTVNPGNTILVSFDIFSNPSNSNAGIVTYKGRITLISPGGNPPGNVMLGDPVSDTIPITVGNP